MSPPSPNPVSAFRWEDSSALEHSCWACPTKSNSPKAIHTCYGIHSIPCMAYHSTMHAIGTSHRCSGCTMSREMHDNRHREIAKLVAEYHNSDLDLESPPGTRRRPLGERSVNMQLRNFVPEQENLSDDDDEHEVNENDDGVSGHDTASTTTSSENSVILKLTKSEQRQRKKSVKAQKSVRKAAKNEARHAVQITTEDVQRIERVLHGDEIDAQRNQTHPLATDKTIEDVIARNLGFVKQIECHKKALYETVRVGRKEEQDRKRARKRAQEGLQDIEAEAVVDAILMKLGVDIVGDCGGIKGKGGTRPSVTPSKHGPGRASNDRTRTVLKLREAIKDDIEKHENDLRQTYIRAGGFFRYAGKAVFERMTEIARSVDLQSGEEWDKKREREARLGLAQMVVEDVDNEN